MLFALLLACTTHDADHAAHGTHADHDAPAAHGHEAEHGHGGHEGHHAKKGEHAHGEHGDVHHRFDDVEKWSKVFDDPERDGWQKPATVVEAMAIEPGMVVADIGAGTGYFNAHFAKAVGETGKVLALDIEESLVRHMTERAEKEGTSNVEVRLTKPEAADLKAGEVDRVVLVDVYHHIQERGAYFGKLKDALKADGRLVIVDIRKTAPFGPPVEHRLTPDQVVGELKEAGFAEVERVEALEHQYIVVLKRA